MRYGLFIDESLCNGCRGCMTACKSWNKLPGVKTEFTGSLQNLPDTTPKNYMLIKFYEHASNGQVRMDYFKQQCFHCGEAACEKACPEAAISHTDKGAVVRDMDKCIGCDYCQRFCPFNVPRIDLEASKMHKCTLCFDRLDNGMPPACAQTCTPGAVKFGKVDELRKEAEKRLQAVKAEYKGATIYPNADALGGTGVFYLLTNSPSFYGLPKNPSLGAGFAVWENVLRPLGAIVPGFTIAGVAVAAVANLRNRGKEGE